ncbi:MAG: hypothetical protein H8D92_02375 [Pelagibacteraceae bacterium]|nr:hypothetical protein [Pelagibacteraceae bacterium]
MPKKLSDRMDRLEGMLEKLCSLVEKEELVSNTIPKKVSTSETKKVSTTKVVVDNLKSVAGLTLAIGHPRKKVMGKDGKQMLDERGYGITQGDDMSREYISFSGFIDWKATEGIELKALASSVGGRLGKGRYDNHVCSAIVFKGGKIPAQARKTIEKVMGRKIQA